MSVLGNPAIPDLQALIAAKDYALNQIGNAYNAFASQWAQQDLAAQADWFNDWGALLNRYGAAKQESSSWMAVESDLTLTPSLTPVPQNYWDDILKAVQQSYPVSTTTKGDLDDLNNRLIAASGKNIDYSQMPQPPADADLEILKAADVVLSPIGLGPSASKGPLSFLGIPWYYWAGGAAVLVGGAVVVTLVKAGPAAAKMAVLL